MFPLTSIAIPSAPSRFDARMLGAPADPSSSIGIRTIVPAWVFATSMVPPSRVNRIPFAPTGGVAPSGARRRSESTKTESAPLGVSSEISPANEAVMYRFPEASNARPFGNPNPEATVAMSPSGVIRSTRPLQAHEPATSASAKSATKRLPWPSNASPTRSVMPPGPADTGIESTVWPFGVRTRISEAGANATKETYKVPSGATARPSGNGGVVTRFVGTPNHAARGCGGRDQHHGHPNGERRWNSATDVQRFPSRNRLREGREAIQSF